MKLITKSLAAASLATAAMAATPAAAQVNGNIGIVSVPAAVAQATARTTAYQQISTTYASQITQIQQKQQQMQTLLQQLDTNNDGQLDPAEQQAAQNAPQAQQLQTLENETAQLSNQIDGARIYAIEQILLQYNAALQTVVQQDNLQLVLSPDAVQYSAPAANVTQKVVAALNTRVPSVQITPPQGWQPAQQSVALYQQVQQILMVAAARQQQAAAQQQTQQPAASGR
ncbi:OmpH family outer membrane protein [Qipengyuania sp. GH38]|uniref:OmpH family outer membrane protein n=1 Tax=Qipengyuania intermedia TaxID=2867244 RepID=UPI001C8877BD|nr:OmpH family outer membrane protein [Qipengyuania intermedia]MBX7514864.1 OmpH family outer membrane protein [Qipengyuania intermedia]